MLIFGNKINRKPPLRRTLQKLRDCLYESTNTPIDTVSNRYAMEYISEKICKFCFKMVNSGGHEAIFTTFTGFFFSRAHVTE